MIFRLGLVVVMLVGCAQMKRDWEAQQAQQQQAQAAAQPANQEQLCKPVADAYCQRCGIAQQQCGQTYIGCVGTASPADNSGLNMGQVQACVADVQAGDCAVMPQVWPASCSVPHDQVAQQPDTTTPQCPAGTTWDGAQCACPAGASWDGTQCVCAAGTTWDGTQCSAAQQPDQPQQPVQEEHAGKRCRKALLDKGYPPDTLANCDGVSDRCAVAVIKKGYPPDTLANCRGVEGSCAETLIGKGYPPDQLANCHR